MTMIPGCSYTLFSGEVTAPPMMTGHAKDEPAARFIVELMMTADETVFRGMVRHLEQGDLIVCARARKPGQFLWFERPQTIPDPSADIDMAQTARRATQTGSGVLPIPNDLEAETDIRA